MPQFENKRDSFCVTLFGERKNSCSKSIDEESILAFCSTQRSREELADFLGINSVAYAITRYIIPLVKEGKIILSIPESPKSPKQRYIAK
jgi:ATP-dependent DNA helicase RecG